MTGYNCLGARPDKTFIVDGVKFDLYAGGPDIKDYYEIVINGDNEIFDYIPMSDNDADLIYDIKEIIVRNELNACALTGRGFIE